MAERLKLKITEVKEPRPVGQTEVLDFLALAPGADKPVKYGVWIKSLYEYIKKDAVIDADVETRTFENVNGDGHPYINRKIVQIYVDGQPVFRKIAVNGGSFRENPEQRASIENQCRAKTIAELWVNSKIRDDDPLVIKLRAWLNKLDANGAMAPVKQTVEVSPKKQADNLFSEN